MNDEINYTVTTRYTVKRKALFRNMFVTNQIFQEKKIRIFISKTVIKRTLQFIVSLCI